MLGPLPAPPYGWAFIALPKALYVEYRRVTGLRDHLRAAPRTDASVAALQRLDRAIELLGAAVDNAHTAAGVLAAAGLSGRQ